MFKHDPIITYNHMQEETKRSHPTFNATKSKWEMFLFLAETGLILLVLTSMILIMIQ